MNILFTSPLTLFAAAFALIPLIIHLIYKRKVLVINFSSIIFIEKSHIQSARSFRLRELLLLIARMGIIFCLVLAVSQPVLKLKAGSSGPFLAAENRNKKIILIIDNSPSMGYYDNAVTVFDEAITKAKEILRMTFEKGDDIAIIPASDLGRYFYNEVHTVEKAESILGDLQLSYSSAVIVDAIKLAEAAYDRTSGLKARIFVLSDFQRSNFSNALYTPPEKRIGDLVLVDMNRKEFFNLAVQSIQVPPIFYSIKSPVNFKVKVMNYGFLTGDGVMEAFLNGKKVSQQSVPNLRHQSADLPFVFNPEQADIHLGRIRLEGDNLKQDDEFFFLDNVVGKLKVTIVDDDETSSYIRKVFDSYEYRSIVEYRVVKSAALNSEALHTDLVILSSFDDLNEASRAALDGFVAGGGPLLVILENDLNVETFNRTIHSAGFLPVRILNKVMNSGGTNDTFRIREQDFTHPLLSFFKEYDFLPLVRFRGYYKTEFNLSDPGFSILAKFNNMSPALITYQHRNERSGESGTVLLVTTSLSGSMNDIVTHPNFPVFIFQVLKYLSGKRFADMAPGTHRTAVMGTLNVPADAKIEKYEVQRKTFTRWDGESVDLPGIYRAGGKYFTVNVPAAESDLTGMEKDSLKKILGELDTIDEKGDLKAQVAAVSGGISLSLFFIILSILLLLMEMFLANNILKTSKKKT